MAEDDTLAGYQSVHGRPPAFEKANILPVHEEVHMASHVSALVHDPVECPGRFPAECSERVTDSLARLVKNE